MHNGLVGFHRSVYGQMTAATMLGQQPHGGVAGADADTETLFWAAFHSDPRTQVVLAHDSFSEMMCAAAVSAPTSIIHPTELLSEHGVLFFSREQDLSDLLPGQLPIRGIRWTTTPRRRGPFLTIQTLAEGRRLEEDSRRRMNMTGERVLPPRELRGFLLPHELVGLSLEADEANGEDIPASSEHLIGLLRSISAIARSPHTASEDRKIQQRIKKHGKVKQVVDQKIRVLSLHNPDYGRYELDAATGRKLRQHWVRGHWRNQWYPGEQINKTIWIDGFVRGDAAIGTVTGQKVYVARAPKLEDVSV
jgi:hypothetical protein